MDSTVERSTPHGALPTVDGEGSTTWVGVESSARSDSSVSNEVGSLERNVIESPLPSPPLSLSTSEHDRSHMSTNSLPTTPSPPLSPLLIDYDTASTSIHFADDGTNTHVVVRTFDVTLLDELVIKVGDTLRVLTLYSDQWCFCIDAHGRRGIVPYDCLEPTLPEEPECCPPYDPRTPPPPRTIVNGSLSAPWKQWEAHALRCREFKAKLFGIDAAVCVVARTFEAKMVDELEVKIGDGILVLESYGDEWSLARNVSSGEMGFIPANCLISCGALERPQTPPLTPPLPYTCSPGATTTNSITANLLALHL